MNTDIKSIKLGSQSKEFYYRDKTSDEAVINQIFVKQEYHIGRLRRAGELIEFHNSIVSKGKHPLIIDAGANIGASPIFFSEMFPSSRVVAIEPETSNFNLLSRNTQGLPIECIHGALASAPGQISVLNPGEGHWGYRTGSADESASLTEQVSCVSINEIYQAQTLSRPFIVKIDIEGGEDELFSKNTEWVEETPLIIIELHDWLLCGTANSRNFLKCISNMDRDFLFIGENVFSISNNLKQ